ncbi:MAG: DUF4846 domain-containing protein, partial [Lachnospiraceae bacterium]|nr:DUF4846 domain-containing protein [Lachnospiraceae bacterium]
MDGDGMIRPYEDDYEQEPETGDEVIELKPEKEKAEDITESENAEAEKKYEFINPSGMTLEERIAVPEGYMRSEAANDSLTAFLRAYPMKEYGSEVHYYDGGVKSYAAQIAVFDMFLGDKDLQQCADSVIRIYAEYLKKNGRQDEIAFHFVSGFLCDYKSWLAGNKVSVAGNNVSWIPGTQRTDNEETFEAYLDTVFCYASTISLKKESEYITLGDAKPGDIFIKAGSPGHVVMIADLCEKEGKKAFLLAQGYMPAQDFYILRNDKHKEDPWYYDNEITYPFSTPEY